MKNNIMRYVIFGFLLGLSIMLLIGAVDGRVDTGRYQLHMAGGTTNAFFNIIDSQTGVVKTYVRGEYAGKKSLLPGKKYESYEYYLRGAVDFNAEEAEE